MTRDDMMRRMSGREFAAWAALFNVKEEERQRAADEAESGDGQVIVHGLDRDDGTDDEDEEPDLSDGETEQ